MSRSYEVVKFVDDWQVKTGDIVLGAYTDKAVALKDAEAIASANAPSTLTIRDDDGAVAEERTF